jgi:hypothetical protein
MPSVWRGQVGDVLPELETLAAGMEDSESRAKLQDCLAGTIHKIGG